MIRVLILSGLAVGAGLVAAQGQTPTPAAPTPPAAAAPAPASPGEAVFRRKCGICHGGHGTGTFMLARRLDKGVDPELAKRTDLDPDYIKTVVRTGLMSMPPLTRVDITDAELQAVAGYLTRNNPKGKAQ